MNKMQAYPPVNFVAAAWVKQNQPKPVEQQVSTLGLGVKKGKVKRHGDLSR